MEKKTVKVRVCVAVDERGNWYAIGGDSLGDNYYSQAALRGVRSGGNAIHCLEAEVPLPVETTIQAEVKEDQ